jgi:SAM-dependent methyltransferase
MNQQEQHRRFWDLYAPTYDSRTTPGESYVRQTSIETLQRHFSPGQWLLEIGGGTGTEAAAMMNFGCRVLVTDNSFEMLRMARRKLGAEAWIVQIPAEDVDNLRCRFDGAYASFGVVNCLHDLPALFKKLHGILKPGAKFVTSFGNRWYLGDFVLWTLRRNNFLKLRWRADHAVSLNGSCHAARARLLSYWQLTRAAQPYFRPRCCVGVPVLLPPPYATSRHDSSGGFPPLLVQAEKFLAQRFPFRHFGDQSVVVFERTNIE